MTAHQISIEPGAELEMLRAASQKLADAYFTLLGEQPTWRPAPELCPDDAAYWYKHEDGARVFILRDGVVLGTEWPRRWNVFYQDEYPLQIAGPLRPPEGDK